jgi:hypothetical protein
MATMKGKRVLTSLYLDPDVAERLKELSRATRVPQAVYLREAVEQMLSHYSHTFDLIARKENPTPIRTPPVLTRLIQASQLPSRKGRARKGAK